jgi:hypothetical protein
MRARRRSNVSRRNTPSSTIATIPMGMLMRKIQRQDMYWASAPPSTGPTIAAMPHTLDRQPWIAARSRTEYKSPASVVTVAMIEPAPKP